METEFFYDTEPAIKTLIEETREKGGSTVSATDYLVPDHGYMVGGIVDSLIFDANLLSDSDHEELVRNMIGQWVDKHFNIAADPSTFLGGWIDKETGQMFVDLSEHFTNEHQALQVARTYGELAIWDIDKGEEIRVS